MLRRFGLLYSIFGVLVLVVLAVLVLGRLNTARSANIQEAQASYRRLESDLADASTLEQIRTQLRDYSRIVPTIQALVLYDPDLGLQFIWTSESDLLLLPAGELRQFRGIPRYSISEITQLRISENVSSADGFRLTLDAVYSVLGFADAYLPLRDSLFALLGFAFLTVTVVLIIGRQPNTSSRERVDRSSVVRAADTSSAPETHVSPARPPVEQTEEIAIEELPMDSSEPGTLFNPITGVSHRAHLDKRLGLELERSAYNDQDLTCALVRFPNLRGEDEYVQAASLVLAAYQFEDLCFEYDQTTFCVILPNTELPQGIKQAEAFRKRNPEAVIGMSARNGRLVEAGRVLKEADSSLGHATTEPGRIVGFRPDPRKYRQFVTQQFAERD